MEFHPPNVLRGSLRESRAAKRHVEKCINKTLDIWLAVNGVNVPRSNTISKFVGLANERIITVTYIYTFTAGQYFELYMRSDDTNTVIIATAAAAGPPSRPACPSIIVTVNKISK